MAKLKLLIVARKIRKFLEDPQLASIINQLKLKVDLQVTWILVEPGLNSTSMQRPLKFNYKDLEDYSTDNLCEILEIENPDIILISNDYDYQIRSFIPAAKIKKIPIILFLTLPSPAGYLDTVSLSQLQDKISLHKDRSKELLRKFSFMLKNYRNAGYGIIKILKIILNEFFVVLTRYQPMGEYGCDYVLVTGRDWKLHLENKHVTSEIEVVGYVKMDEVFRKLSKYKERPKKNSSKMKAVFLTTPLVEHGLWTEKEWEETLSQTIKKFQEFRDYLQLVLKIHPTSESKTKYDELITRIGCNIPIYQNEDLFEILSNSDFVITYGYSSGIFEALFLEKPVIVVNLFDYPIKNMPFVAEGLAHELKNINNLRNLILNIKTMKVDKEKLDKYISKYIYKFDGEASQRIADSIVRCAQEFKKIKY